MIENIRLIVNSFTHYYSRINLINLNYRWNVYWDSLKPVNIRPGKKSVTFDLDKNKYYFSTFLYKNDVILFFKSENNWYFHNIIDIFTVKNKFYLYHNKYHLNMCFYKNDIILFFESKNNWYFYNIIDVVKIKNKYYFYKNLYLNTCFYKNDIIFFFKSENNWYLYNIIIVS